MVYDRKGAGQRLLHLAIAVDMQGSIVMNIIIFQLRMVDLGYFKREWNQKHNQSSIDWQQPLYIQISEDDLI